MSRYALLAATSFVVLAAACCHHDDRPRYAYGDCNPGGCFGCTDNTQQACWPLPYQPCRSNSECADKELCTTLGCATRCGSDEECREGEVCTAAGYCAPGNAKSNPVEGPGGGGGGGNQSVPGLVPCALDSQCFPGEACVGGQCTHSPSCGIPANLCSGAGDCGDGRTCILGACHQVCVVGVRCPIGQICSSGACMDAPLASQCVFDYQCGPASRCINATCHPLCGVDSQCGTGELCDSGVCRADIRPAVGTRH